MNTKEKKKKKQRKQKQGAFLFAPDLFAPDHNLYDPCDEIVACSVYPKNIWFIPD